MSTSVKTESLFKIIQNYKKENLQPSSVVREFLHFHEKNPDAEAQIALLNDIKKYIDSNLTGKEQKKVELGALLILRALLSDTNSRGQVFAFLIEKLELDNAIEEILKEVEPNEKMDLTHADYITTSREAIEACKAVIEKPEILQKHTTSFLRDLFGTINTELDYDNRMLFSLRR